MPADNTPIIDNQILFLTLPSLKSNKRQLKSFWINGSLKQSKFIGFIGFLILTKSERSKYLFKKCRVSHCDMCYLSPYRFQDNTEKDITSE